MAPPVCGENKLLQISVRFVMDILVCFLSAVSTSMVDTRRDLLARESVMFDVLLL